MARTFEDFRVEDGKVYRVRKDNEQAFKAMMQDCRHQIEAGVARQGYHRTRYRIPNEVQLKIWNKYGPEYDFAVHNKWTEQMKRKMDQVLRLEFPHCVLDWGRKYHQGGL